MGSDPPMGVGVPWGMKMSENDTEAATAQHREGLNAAEPPPRKGLCMLRKFYFHLKKADS